MIKTNELIKRILVCIVGIPIIILISMHGKIPFLVFISLIMIASLWEFYNFNSFDNKMLYIIIGSVAILLINTDFYLNSGKNIHSLLTVTVILIIIFELLLGKDNMMINISIPLLGIVYIHFFTFYILIREHIFSEAHDYSYAGYFILFIFSILWAFDISAYIWGSLWGKHTLFSRISPNKSWEGTILGIITALLVSFFVNHYLNINLSFILCLIFTLVVCLTAQISDLVESMFKRDSRIKDSSQLLPGHGGIFDRFDSFFLVGPISYLMIKLFF